MLKQLLLLGMGLNIATIVFSQTPESDNAFVQSAENNAITAYHQYTGKQARLNNGIQEDDYLNSIEGFAYFLTNSFQPATVVYDGIVYTPVQLLYDSYKDHAVILTYGGLRLILLEEKLSEFSVSGYHFVRHDYDSTAKSSLPGGYYNHLYEGKKMSAYVKRIKLLNEKVTDKVEQKFIEQNKYYAVRNGSYESFHSYRGFLKLFGDKSKAIRKHLDDKDIIYKKDRDNAIVTAMKYFDTLN